MKTKLINPHHQGVYETYPFKQDFGIFLNLFPLNQPQRYVAVLKGKVGKKIETVITWTLNFEIVEVD
jgi:hypothetical protein